MWNFGWDDRISMNIRKRSIAILIILLCLDGHIELGLVFDNRETNNKPKNIIGFALSTIVQHLDMFATTTIITTHYYDWYSGG